MTKRDSVAGFDSPRHHTSMQRRQFNHPFQPRSGDASSTTATSSAPAMSSWDHHPHQTHDSPHGRTSSNAHAYGYTSEAPPVPLPDQRMPTHTPKRKHIRYRLRSNKSIESFILTFSRRSWLPPFRPGKLPHSYGSRYPRIPTKPPTGFFLQWYCWSCES